MKVIIHATEGKDIYRAYLTDKNGKMKEGLEDISEQLTINVVSNWIHENDIQVVISSQFDSDDHWEGDTIMTPEQFLSHFEGDE